METIAVDRTGTSSENGERSYFACAHVIAGRAIEAFMLNANSGKGEADAVLCGACYWCNTPAELFSAGFLSMRCRSYQGVLELEGERFTETKAVAREYVPRSRAMRYLLSICNDSSGGLAVESPRRVFWRRLHCSGLSEAEKDFLADLFFRGGAEWDGEELNPPLFRNGFAPLTDEEEGTALRLIDRMFREPQSGAAE